MDPDNTTQVSPMELPHPQTDATKEHSELSEVAPVTEAGSAQALEQGVSQAAPPTDPPFDMNLGPQPAVSTTFDPAQPIDPALASAVPPNTGLPAIADDNDLIEKEWVEKAKQIVEKTKADPHEQNKAMSKMKVDYLKKRYNKEVKLVEE